jgi:acyl-CoA synthetase (NDP forming)
MTVAEAANRTASPTAGGDAVARLLKPRSVAIVGAQPEPTSIGGGVLSNLERFGYAGEIHLVSRSKDEIRGRPCVKSIADLPHGIDVAVLIVPQAAIMDSVRACIERGMGAVVVFASGFAEASDEGRAQQETLAALCRDAGIALLGPNCMGYTNYIDGVPLTFEPVDVRGVTAGSKRVAIVAQSGATAANMRFAMHARAIDVSYVVATGNEATLGAEHFIEFLIADPQNAAIGVYVEQIRNPAYFIDVARRARMAGIPIVLLHPGSSEKGRHAAQSHTGALAGDHAVMQTILRAEAVALVDTTDELFDVLAILSRFPAPPPGKAGIVTNSGAIRGLCFDFAETVGLELAVLAPEVDAEMKTLVPPYVHVDNPFDIGTVGFADPTIYGTSAAVMLKDPGVGMAMLSYAGGSPKMQIAKSDAIIPVYAAATKPVILNIIGDDYPLDDRFMADVRASGIPFFRSPERAMRAMAAVARYAEALAATGAATASPGANVRVVGSGVIPEYRGKQVLADLGLRVPRGGMATSADEAAQVSAGIGYPVVIKAQAAALAHKSDAGGVIVNIADEAALRAAWNRLHASVAAAKPGLALDGVLVEEMAKPGLEMVVGARRDPQWGPVVLVGLGGVWIEALADARLLPAAATREQALAELGRLKAAKLLGPFRGQPARDVGAIADVVVKLGQLMLSDPAISEVDINPLVVGADGEGAVALDALFVRD